MSFDPTKPANISPLVSQVMRDQFNGLKTLIDAVPAVSDAHVDGVNTVNPDDPATAEVEFTGGALHFSFDLPRGHDGLQGEKGDPGPQGEPGEVSNQQLSDAIDGTPSNVNGVDTLNLTISDPPTQAELEQVLGKLNELIGALHR
jgi:hypothetical protein